MIMHVLTIDMAIKQNNHDPPIDDQRKIQHSSLNYAEFFFFTTETRRLPPFLLDMNLFV